jgi:hypothetical protein
MRVVQWCVMGVLVFPMVSCGGGTTTQPLSGSEVIQQLNDAEKQGLLPKLNRDNTITGSDTNHNGVRDDIEAYIESLPDTPEQKSALRQDARVINEAMTVDVTNQKLLENVSLKIERAVRCLGRKYTKHGVSTKKGKEIQAFMVNTKERFIAYQKYNMARSGSVSSSLPWSEDGCDGE